MSILANAEKVGATAVRYTWSGTAPYDVWVNGERVLEQTELEAYVIESYGVTPVYAVEVIDADDVNAADSQRYSPRLRLQWRGQADAAVYLIERYEDAAWVTKQIARESGRGYYTFTTPAEADGATAHWRVLAEDERGYQSEVAALSHVVVCNPGPPDVAFSYDEGTGLLTVSAGS